MDLLVKVLGAIGLLLITWGIFIKSEEKQDWVFVAGGLCLLCYSAYLKDPIFIPLQIIFTSASLYEIYTLRRKSQIVPKIEKL